MGKNTIYVRKVQQGKNQCLVNVPKGICQALQAWPGDHIYFQESGNGFAVFAKFPTGDLGAPAADIREE